MRFATIINVKAAAIIAGYSCCSSTVVEAFAPAPFVLMPGVLSTQQQQQRTDVSVVVSSTMLRSVRIEAEDDPYLDLSGSTWTPTDSQVVNDNAAKKVGPAIPGIENLGEDAVVMGGIELHRDIPDGMEFLPGSVPDGTIDFHLPLTASTGQLYVLEIRPFCMGYEDYYAAFTQDSNPVFRIEAGAVGRMDRRGGEKTYLDIICDNKGQAGEFEGTIVVNLPDDGSKLTYSVKARTIG